MTRCPVCDEELDDYLSLDYCKNCGYTDHRGLVSKRNYLFEIADIVSELDNDIRNINTDEELEEIEENLQEILSLIERVLSLIRQSESDWNETNTDNARIGQGTFTKGSGKHQKWSESAIKKWLDENE